MAIQKNQAILLRKKDFRETSLILSFFTEDFGKIHGILKGARGSRARSGISPLFFSMHELVYYEKKKSDLFIISQCETSEVFFNILKEINRAAAGYYMLELTDVFTETGGPSKEIFDILLNALRSLNQKNEPGSVARLFEVKMLMSMGLWPGSEELQLTKGAQSSLARMENDNWQGSSKIKFTKEVGEEIKDITKKIIEENIDRPLKSVKSFKSKP